MKNLFIVIAILTSIACTQDSDIKIIEVNKSVDEEITNRALKEACESWLISKENIELFFNSLISITSEEVHYKYYNLPCSYDGNLIKDSQEFSFYLNAGGWVVLKGADGNQSYYISTNEELNEVFLMEEE
ncbi:hypothetical protein [Nonlabens sp.]|uniref:hypothetical protein n=1 Tax=Nonlabens sp. TaxID=1888209 RepID=UPI003F6A2ACD